ncbi:MAG: NINE protein [Saprospiraceae bacterium]|mgnify:FL=1|nr:NINE protein [Saprospiraceae bacterium]
MRSKTAAGLFAFFLGWAGVHRFYLGQVGLGIFYVFLTFISFGIITGIMGLIDAIVFFSMTEEKFDLKYNSQQGMVPPIYNRRGQQGYPPVAQPRQRTPVPTTSGNRKAPAREVQNPYKVNGIKKYKEFDLEGAIEDFVKGLEIHPRDISLHFNLACAYSLTEQVDKAYIHIDRAVALGFNDFEKLKTHDDLAFVRIQNRFEEFQKNAYRLEIPAVVTEHTQPPETPTEEPIQDDNLLSQLKRLAELRDRGLLSEQEFMIEKRKLTR